MFDMTYVEESVVAGLGGGLQQREVQDVDVPGYCVGQTPGL